MLRTRFNGALLLVVLIISIMALAVPLLSSGPVHAALTQHAPIIINGNADFTATNGVADGSGTKNDPYIIQNWAISAENAQGIEISNTTSYFIVRNCLVENGGVSFDGIFLYNTVNGKIENFTSYNNYSGIHLDSSSNNTLTNSSCSNDEYGIRLDSSSNNTLTNNSCYNSSSGIYLSNSDNDNLTNNACDTNYYGISIYSSSGDTLTNNSSDNNGYGIYLSVSNDDRIYHNNFVNNVNQAFDDGSNSWDNGYPSGGNYWSDYTGIDNNGDEIGDTPYNIYGGSNQDHYPLMSPWSPVIAPCTGAASIRMAGTGATSPPFLWGIRKVVVNGSLTVQTGDNLHLIFLDGSDWTLPGGQLDNLIVPHDNNLTWPCGGYPSMALAMPAGNVKRVKLVLEDNSGNVILDNMAWYTVVQDDWSNRITWTILRWGSHTSCNQDQLSNEISSIILNWGSCPTSRDQHDFLQAG
jgi:parallel beta-helix repeat protein